MEKNPQVSQPLAKRENHTLHCPKCQKELFVVYHEEVEVDTCLECHGLWLDPYQEMLALKKRPAGLSADELRQLRKLYQPLGKLEKVKYFPCPVCDQMMKRKNWGNYSGIIVDYCDMHGTWYDDQELDKIKEYVLLGGAEYQKMGNTQDDLQRIKRKLGHEVERLDSRVTHARIMNLFFGV